MTTFMPARADFHVMPAHSTNYGYGSRALVPRAVVIHTPEEEADDREITPVWFANEQANSSTHFFVNDDETPARIIQMVPISKPAWGQGVAPAARLRRDWPWCPDAENYNWYSVGIEVEGKAATLNLDLKPGQFDALVDLTAWLCTTYGIPVTRDFIVGHDELSKFKRDPGVKFPWSAFMYAVKAKVRGVPSVAPSLNDPDNIAHAKTLLLRAQSNIDAALELL